eukprot:8586598-Pyramimonas_sp.AAC.1
MSLPCESCSCPAGLRDGDLSQWLEPGGLSQGYGGWWGYFLNSRRWKRQRRKVANGPRTRLNYLTSAGPRIRRLTTASREDDAVQ